MLILIQSTSGQVNTMTLSERVTLTSPYFLLRLICDTTKTETSCIISDVSPYTYRYNKFLITEKANPTRINGEVYLPTIGGYTYEVYEQLSSTNLDYTLCDNTTPIEIGVLKVYPLSSTATTIYTGASDEKIIYNP